MERFKTVSSLTACIPMQDIDTDLLIPAQYLTSISREGYGENLFRRLRDSDPNFCLNHPDARNYKILVAGSNFGCGSSREHAVWALQGWGFKAVIAPSFADIFSGNSAKNGLLLITQPVSIIERLLSSPQVVTVDLEQQRITFEDGEHSAFAYDPFQKHCLLEGLDELDYLLSKRDVLQKYFKASPVQRFQQPIRSTP